MSVLDRSPFSYHVAAGSTTSENSVVDVIRKSIDISMSSLPSGTVSGDVTSLGRRPSAAGSPCRFESVPSRCCKKYSLPLLEEPSRFERHTLSTRGQFFGLSGSVTDSVRSPLANCSAT